MFAAKMFVAKMHAARMFAAKTLTAKIPRTGFNLYILGYSLSNSRNFSSSAICPFVM